MSMETRKLGLAAYVKICGSSLLGINNGVFLFDSDRDESDWEMEYVNTECYRHDTELMNLRKQLDKSKKLYRKDREERERRGESMA